MTGAVVKLKKIERTPIVPARNIEEVVRNLLNHGWTRYEYPTLSRQFEGVISAFVGMTTDERRDEYMITSEREFDAQGEQDLGLMYATKGELKKNPRPDEIAEGRTRYDETKFKFHASNRLFGYYGRTPKLIMRHPNFFLGTMRMLSEASLLTLEIAEELDRHLHGFNFAERVKTAEHEAKLRLLRYLCDGTSPGIAQRHRDRDFLTIHIRSDREGLWIADNNDRIIANPEETRANSVLIFFGRKAWEITRGRLKGLVHGVIDTTFNDLAGRTPRHTAVFFGHAHQEEAERQWGIDHADELRLQPHVANYGLM